MEQRVLRTSELLAIVASSQTGERVRVEDLVNALRNRAFGMVFLVFGIPNCIPLPPGVPVLCGIVLALVGIQMALGRTELWLPRRVAEFSFPRSTLDTVVTRAMPWIVRFERWSRPRYRAFAGPAARRVVGLIVVLLGFILILPIPFLGNLPPGIAVCILGIGLIERDGLVILAGFAATILGLAVTAFMTVALAEWVLSWF